MSDFIEVTVIIDANGEFTKHRISQTLRVGDSISIEAAKAAADCAARASLLHQLGPLPEAPE